jgi:hypothetical protein
MKVQNKTIINSRFMLKNVFIWSYFLLFAVSFCLLKSKLKRMPLPSGLGFRGEIMNCFQKKSPTEAGLKIFIYGI